MRSIFEAERPDNTRRYTPEEDELVLNSTGGDVLLAQKISRSRESIQVRRWRLRRKGK